jgi:uncharacterized protein YbgA (DUF1722 family)/uncharacterized protein YbbK (DUF523 family)
MTAQTGTIKIGISACLLGHPVRYNGGHKASTLCKDVLSHHFDFVAVCPEQSIGLGTPRQPIRLISHAGSARAVGTVNPQLDVTEALTEFGQRTAQELSDICGYILMQKSPSCGMERVKTYQSNGQPAASKSRGLFAEALMQALPDLPVEEEGRLNDPVLRENFITRVFAYAEWQRLMQAGMKRHALIQFHQRYKYLLMATARKQYQQLGQLVAQCGVVPLHTLAPRYFSLLMAALKQPASRGTHTNVLQHLSGYLKRALDAPQKQELQDLIEQYRQGIVPLVAPLTLIKHHFRQHPDAYIARQLYLQPHPEALGLRNAL